MQTCRDFRNPSRSFRSGSVCPGLTSPKTRSCIQAPVGLPQLGMCQFAGFLRAITVCGAGVPRKPNALTPQGSSSFCTANVGMSFSLHTARPCLLPIIPIALKFHPTQGSCSHGSLMLRVWALLSFSQPLEHSPPPKNVSGSLYRKLLLHFYPLGAWVVIEE